MDTQQQPTEKPNLDNVEMHMPEGDVSIPDAVGKKNALTGPIILLLIFVLVLLLGGMIWWYFETINEPVVPTATRPTAEENNEPESTTAEARVETTQALSTSDNLSVIEADLAGTEEVALESEFAAIESVLDNPNP